MNLQSRFITKDDFKEYFGIDLDAELKSDANNSNKAEMFLTRVTNRLEAFLQAQFFKKLDYEYAHFTDYQKEHYKLALLEQALYVFKNGDISVMSGLVDNNVATTRKQLNEITIGQNCKNELLLCGLWNVHIGGNYNIFVF